MGNIVIVVGNLFLLHMLLMMHLFGQLQAERMRALEKKAEKAARAANHERLHPDSSGAGKRGRRNRNGQLLEEWVTIRRIENYWKNGNLRE